MQEYLLDDINHNKEDLSLLRPKFIWKARLFYFTAIVMIIFIILPFTIMGTMSKTDFERFIGIRGSGTIIVLGMFFLAFIAYISQIIIYYINIHQCLQHIRESLDWRKKIKQNRLLYSAISAIIFLIFILFILFAASNDFRRQIVGSPSNEVYLAVIIGTLAISGLLVKFGSTFWLFRKIKKELL